ncbi:hypothetical protein [Streptomyces shenzhenensis]|uniref:hypothetical protein n=1 Tax=Streptomyces shenzhenensis TaxID=943815 RepID=UPI002867F4C3|nr:hypothetical protein [Streptomyces shenzhenensis]
MTTRPRSRSLRTRLLVLVTAVLVCVCAAMALTTVFAQRAYLLGNLDNRVSDAMERNADGAALHPELTRDLAFLDEGGQPAGMLAARVDAEGNILSAAVVGHDAPPRSLTTAQTDALKGIAPDGSAHTRTVPGLGTYRVAALDASGIRVLTGLPMDDVLDTISGLVAVETGVAVAGLTAAGCVCAVVIRRQL